MIIFKILRIAFMLLFLYTAGFGILIFVFMGCIDFPCSVRYDEIKGCVDDRWVGDEDKTNYKIESFLDVYIAGSSGAGCNFGYSESNILDISTSVIPLHLERDGSSLIVNGDVLEEGDEFKKLSVLNWNPWVISKIKFKNLGLIKDCNSPKDQRIVILGGYGSRISLIKGLSILFVSIGGFIFAQIKIRRSKRSILFEE